MPRFHLLSQLWLRPNAQEGENSLRFSTSSQGALEGQVPISSLSWPVTRLKGLAVHLSGRIRLRIRKRFLPQRWLGTEQASQGSGHSTKPFNVQEVFRQHWGTGTIPGVQGQELELMIPMGPSARDILWFCGSMSTELSSSAGLHWQSELVYNCFQFISAVNLRALTDWSNTKGLRKTPFVRWQVTKARLDGPLSNLI